VGGRSGVSAAYPLNQATINLLDDIPRIHDQAVRQAAQPDLTVTVGFKVNSPTSQFAPFPFTPPSPVGPQPMGL